MMGWYIFPCKENKKPYTIHGFLDASTDAETITKWWESHPDALIGIYCEKSGIFALDIDLDKDRGINGFYSLAELINNVGDGQALLPMVGPIQSTPRGGQHYLFKLPEGISIPNTANKLGAGLDLRSNGYICTGAGYNWILGHGPTSSIRDAPDWMLEAIRKFSEKPSPYRTEPQYRDNSHYSHDSGNYWLERALSQAVVGTRNDTGFWLACQLRDAGITKDEGEIIMADYAFHVPGSGYSSGEALASLKSAYRQPARTPAKGVRSISSIAILPELNADDNQAETPSFVEIPPLPEAARVDSALGADACSWLDNYIAFSRIWSPRAYESFHEACALWILSTVAARRVYVHMGKPRYTNLYLSLTARTSLYAKSTTAEIALQAIQATGLSWLLAADSTTPQKFISDLTTRLVSDYENLSDEQKAYARLRVGTAGQRGWFYDEFGQHVASMMRDNGFMADFRGLLRRMEDTPDRYEYGSIARGSDVIERPYLALLANMTPDDLRPFAKRGAALWGDGFLARFALITPPEEERRHDRFPKGERIIPGNILSPLVDWHKRLGLPHVELEDITDSQGKSTGSKRVEVTPNKTEQLCYTPEVYEAFYAYDEGLLDILQNSTNHDLDGNYARLSEKALRVAALLTSITGTGTIELSHWARALEITEGWRAGLHQLYNQINEPAESMNRQMEEKLLTIVQKLGGATAADCGRYVRNLSTAEATHYLDGLAAAGLLNVDTTHRNTKKYRLDEQ